MSDTPAEPTRDQDSGRYVRRHSAEEQAAAGSADSDSGETTDVPPPPPPPGADGDDKDEKNGKKRWLLLLLLLLILLLLVCAGFAYNKWWGDKGPDPVATATPTTNATATARPSPSVTASSTASPTPSPTQTVRTINMPNVVGMPAADAKVILEGAGFTSIKFIDEGKDGDELKVLISFAVTKQSAAAGTAIPADTALVITCKVASNGKG